MTEQTEKEKKTLAALYERPGFDEVEDVLVEEREETTEGRSQRSRKGRYVLFATAGCGLLLFFANLWYHNQLTPPVHFPVQHVIEIPQGTSVSGTAALLAEQAIIKNAFVFKLVHGDRGVQAGRYYFESPLTIHEISHALENGANSAPPFSITIPEGYRIAQIDALAAEHFLAINAGDILARAPKEGYLFPDTYFVSETITAKELVALMSKTFQEKIAPLENEIQNSGHTQDEIITMASIIEREASTKESKHLVAGILWKRIEIGMALQVDAPFEYVLNKPGTELTRADLEIDSPYNTYTNVGLTPTPITNPGIEAIEAALRPKENPYLFYITAPDGTFHYAENFAQHTANVRRYLR